jgi:DnaJ-class molecular chaperone
LKFAEVRDSYEILNDPDKKILYDTGGMEAVKKGEKGEAQKTDDVNSEMAVNLVDLYTGNSDYKATLQRRIVCRGCQKNPSSPKCSGCGRCPNEIKVVNVQMGPFVTQQQQEVPSKQKCKNTDAVLEVNLEKGMRDGESLTFPRMAEERPGMLPGSVILKIKQNKHPLFTRKTNDLQMDMTISLREALLGWSQTIRHLDGHTVELSTTDVTRHLQVIKAKSEGMPLRDDPASFGDLLVKVHVEYPSKLDASQKEAIAKIFPPSLERPMM